MLTGLFEP